MNSPPLKDPLERKCNLTSSATPEKKKAKKNYSALRIIYTGYRSKQPRQPKKKKTQQKRLLFKSTCATTMILYCSSKKETPSYDRGKAKITGVSPLQAHHTGAGDSGLQGTIVDPPPSISPHSPVSRGNPSSTALWLTHVDREDPLSPCARSCTINTRPYTHLQWRTFDTNMVNVADTWRRI